MRLPRAVSFLIRAIFGLFLFLTASYCLLAYLPFTYHQIVVEAPLPWLSMFVRFHPYWYWFVLGLQVVTLIPDLRGGAAGQPADARPGGLGTKIPTIGFLVFAAGLGVVLLVHPVLALLQNNDASFYSGLLFLLPLAWLGALDWLGQRPRLQWQAEGTGEDWRIFMAAWESALFVSVVYFAIFFLRWGRPLASGFGNNEALLSLTWTVLSHMLVFMGVFVCLFLVHLGTSWFGQPAKMEFAFCAALGVLMVAAILRFLVFPLVSFVNARADVFALATGAGLGIFWAGLSAKLFPAEKSSPESGLALLLTPLRWGRMLPGAWGFAPFALLALLAYFLEVRSAVLDWNFLRQKLSALLIWVAAFANFYELAPRKRQGMSLVGRIVLIVVAVASFGAYKTLGLWQRHDEHQEGIPKIDVAATLESYAAFDASFKLVHDALTPAAGGEGGFYKFLVANTNLPWSAETRPVEVNLVDHLTPTNSPKPNIFIMVIDSLRRDYLSSYNPAVTFTPNIEAFGRESVVMENAFAKYAGTGLSEPSIWSGAMLLHEQYVTPFQPMNALRRLVETDGYHWFLMNDFILKLILIPPQGAILLDSDIPGRRYDFCQTLGDLEEEISQRKGSAPIFFYSQPQNIHMWTLHQEGESVPPGEDYPGFYAPVASRLKQMDVCWGKFIAFLKKNGLYDNSIIILTADHGDLLGEHGAWGHGFALFKEMIEIPLIIHLPPALRSHLNIDPKEIAFLTDITPSLYYLLGHRPIVRNEIFGKPLFTETAEEKTPYLRDSYLIISSYTPVYGILKQNGHWLYFVSANDVKDFLFDLPENSMAIEKPVTESLRADSEQLIRQGILAIDHFYHFQSPQ